jgi:MYXO-CTERM domain-containing protein
LVPTVMALRQMGPEGLRSAEACTGGVPGAGWDSLEVADASQATRVSIATDGFVLLDAVKIAEGFSLNDGEPTVRVTDAQGGEVSGKIQLLRRSDDPLKDSDRDQLHLGWQADEPLEVGTMLELTFSVRDLGEQSLELEVVGDPAPLPKPSAMLGAWVDVRHGVGDVGACEAGEGVCGVFEIDVPTREVKLRGVQVSWALPEITGMVAWEVRAETSELVDRGDGPEEPPIVVGREVASRPTVSAGLVTFAADADDHCVVVIVKDLRTDEEVRSEPSCGKPADPELMKADHRLRDCWEPPTQESIPLWCEGRTNALDICDGDWVVSHGGAGNDGEREGGGGTDDQAGRGGSDAGSGGAPDVPRPRGGTSGAGGGCQLAPADGAWGSAVLALAALLAGVARRRRGATNR